MHLTYSLYSFFSLLQNALLCAKVSVSVRAIHTGVYAGDVTLKYIKNAFKLRRLETFRKKLQSVPRGYGILKSAEKCCNISSSPQTQRRGSRALLLLANVKTTVFLVHERAAATMSNSESTKHVCSAALIQLLRELNFLQLYFRIIRRIRKGKRFPFRRCSLCFTDFFDIGYRLRLHAV